jgi:hypothetical protein
MTNHPYLSVGELASLLRVSTKWCYQRMKDIPGSFKLGGCWFVDREILLSSLKDLAAKPKLRMRSGGEGFPDPHKLL